ncbi:MAG TPA: hypothetical protein VFA98_05395 [Thermoanaerobaculia bacterium]|nr:hypothetical protein [Thermoanaerobaculia bacterium]
MRHLSVFNNVTLDGFFSGPGGDSRWAQAGGDDPEYQAFRLTESRAFPNGKVFLRYAAGA